jgi:eukaryotic-like serine/threonine-protein kinase
VVLGLSLICLGIVVTGWALRRGFGAAEASRRAAATLTAPGAEAAELRVVAHPWAHVFVDGQQRETTPFARPLKLSPGTHYVRLEHPNAPPERRTVTMAVGEGVLLEVDMKVVAPKGSAVTTPPSASAELSSP